MAGLYEAAYVIGSFEDVRMSGLASKRRTQRDYGSDVSGTLCGCDIAIMPPKLCPIM